MRKAITKMMGILLAMVMIFSLMPGFTQVAHASGAYNVNLDDMFHGNVTRDKETADEGETVTLTPIPESGYVLDSLRVFDLTAHEDVPTSESGDKYTFVMPASDVFVMAEFKESSTPATTTYAVTVSNGTAYNESNDPITSANAGDTVRIKLDRDAVPDEKYFDPAVGPTVTPSVTLTQPHTAEPSWEFTMPGENVSVSFPLSDATAYTIDLSSDSATVPNDVAMELWGVAMNSDANIDGDGGFDVHIQWTPGSAALVTKLDTATIVGDYVKKNVYSKYTPVTYKFSAAPVTKYPVWVGGLQATSANKDDILSDGGKAKFDPDTNTLTLDGLSADEGMHASGASIVSTGIDLTITGSATLSGAGYGIYVIRTTAGGDLTLDNATITYAGSSASDTGIKADGNIIISGGTINVSAYKHGVLSSEGEVTITDGTVNAIATGPFGAPGDGSGIESDGITISGGSVTATGTMQGIFVGRMNKGITVSGGTVVAKGTSTHSAGIAVAGEAAFNNGLISVTADGGACAVGAGSISIDTDNMIKEPAGGTIGNVGTSVGIKDGTETALHALIVPKEATTFAVTFDANSGSGTMTPNPVTVNAGEKLTLPECTFTPPSADKEFDKWDAGKPGDEVEITSDCVIRAIWKEKTVTTYTVTFDANGHGTAPAAQTVEEGKTATKPADPTETGWTFGGWYKEAACTTAFDFSTPITADIALYAKWTEDSVTPPAPTTYTVTFDANGHGTAPAAQTINSGEKATEPTAPTESGWTFGGWYQNAACSAAFDFSTPITADITLYAKWTEESVTPSVIAYTVMGGGNSTWTKGSTSAITITVKRSEADDTCFSHFSSVQIDGTTLAAGDYEAKSGSTVITLKAATLQKLSTGSHTITILFDDGTAETKLTVKAASSADKTTPPTGDNSHMGLWITMMILSMAVIGGMALIGRKRRYAPKH